MSNRQPNWKAEAIELVRVLRSGGVVLTSTDTVWGLACDATQPEAVGRMVAMKGRPEEKSFLALVADDPLMERLLPDLPESAWELMEASDRPVTVVAQAGPRHGLAAGMVREDGSLGVRRVNDPYLEFIARGLNQPLASTSANWSGEASDGTFGNVPASLIEAVDAVGTFRRDAPPGSPSWVVQFDAEGRFKVLRP